MMRVMPIRPIAAGIALTIVPMAGCGTESSTSSDREATTTPSEARHSDPIDARRRTTNDPERRRVIRAPDGTPSIILPPKPATTDVRPSRGCVLEKSPGSARGVLLPPTPGVTAQISGGEVLISYRVASGRAGCSPDALRVTLSSSEGSGGSVTETHDLVESRGTVRVAIPDTFSDAPDTARVSTITHDGTRSKVSSVAITPTRAHDPD